MQGINYNNLVRIHRIDSLFQHMCSLGLLSIHIQLYGCNSLKDKRSLLKPLLARLHREFNISVAEIGLQENWGESQIVCVFVSNETDHTQQALQKILNWIESLRMDFDVVSHQIEIL